MLVLNVTSDIQSVTYGLVGKLRDQIPFGTAKALTQTAKDAQAEVAKRIPEVFDRPIQFTRNAIAISWARKSLLESSVFIRPIQAKYLSLEITGGALYPEKTARVVPVQVNRNVYGSIPRGRIKSLLRRKDVFSGNVNGNAGIWQRLKDGHLKMLIAYEPRVTYRKRFDFEGIVRATVARTLIPNLNAALLNAIATAR